MKKLIILPVCLLLCSCIRTVNLQDRAIVQAVGVDIENGQYAITLQVFSPDGSGGQTIVDPTKQNSRVITCYGKTVAEALEETSISQGKVFFMGHNRLIVLGESCKKRNLKEILDFFVTSGESRADVKVMASEGEAYDILAADINQGILPAQSIEKTVENAYDNSKIANTFLIDILKNDDVLIPVIRTFEEKGERELKTVALEGSELYTLGEYKVTFNLSETRGALFLKGWGKTAVFSAENGVSVRVYKAKTTFKNNKTVITLDGEVLENSNEKALETAHSDIVKEITLQCNSAISKAKKYNSSIFYSDEVEVRLNIRRNLN